MNSRLRNFLAVFLCIALALAIVCVFVIGTTQKNKRSQELIKKSQEGNKVATLAVKGEESKESISSYEKIKNKKGASILILGDYIAQSEGAESKNKWSSILADSIEKNYGTQLAVTLLANKDQGISKTLSDYNNKEAANKYDFVIICVGADDVGVLKIEQFRKSYEALVRKIKEGNSNCEVISIIESSIKIDKTYPDSIKSICDYYEIPYLDGREVFKRSNIDYSKLTLQDGQTPNIDGFKLYGEGIYNLIKTNIENGKTVKSSKKDLLYNN